MTTPSTFLKIGSYLPSAVLVAATLMFGGLREWIRAGWVELEDGPGKGNVVVSKKWVTRRRDLLDAFVVMAASHLIGLILFVTISRAWLDISKLVCSVVFVSFNSFMLMITSELHNPAGVLDNPGACSVEIPFAW